METRLAGVEDAGHLAGLLRRFADHEEFAGEEQTFAQDLLSWWEAHLDSHVPFLALLAPSRAVGMVWLALAARVPRPGRTSRLCGDVQSLYVVPEHRSAGIGTALVRAVLQHAEALGLEHVTVHSNERAVSLYERAGFTSTRELLMRP